MVKIYHNFIDNGITIDMMENISKVPADQLVCIHSFHSNKKYPDRIPPPEHIESHCKHAGKNGPCSFLKARKEGKTYPTPPPGVIFYREVAK
jgi:hypothetical protein